MAAIKMAVACLWAALSLSALAADDGAAQADFGALYARMNAAMSSRNTAELGALLAPGFRGEDVAGKVRNAKQLLQEVAGLKDDPSRKLETTFSALAVDGGTARTVRRLRITTTGAPPDPTPAMEYVAVSDDVWIRADQGWKLSTSTVREADFSMKGKLLVHKTRDTGR